MSGAIKAGSVYVAVSASIGEFAKSMQAMVKQAEDTAKKVKESAAAVAAVGGLFAAGITAAVDQASATNAALAADVERIKKLVYTLAGDIGDMFAPAVRKIADAIERVVAFIQRLDPGVKQALANAALFAAGTGVVAAQVSVAAGLVEGLAKATGAVLVPALKGAASAADVLGKTSKAAFPLLGQMAKGLESSAPSFVASFGKMALSVFGVLIPVAAVVAAVAGIALAAGAVYAAWNDSSTGLRDSVMEAVAALRDYASKAVDFFRDLFTGLRSFLLAIAATMLDIMLANVRTVAGTLETVAKAFGKYDIAAQLAEVQKLTGEAVVVAIQERMQEAGEAAGAALSKGVSSLAEFGKAAAENVTSSLAYSAAGLKQLLADAYDSSGLEGIVAKVQGLISQLTNGGPAKTRTTEEEADAAQKADEEWAKYEKELADMARAAAEDSRSEFVNAMQADQAAAAESFRVIQEDAQRMADSMAAARRSLVDSLMSRMGEVSNLLGTAMQGFTAGGPMGAAIAVLIDLLTRSEAFATIINMVNVVIQDVSNALGAFFVPLEPLVGAVSMITNVVGQTVAPIMTFFGEMLATVTPVVATVGILLAGLQPLFTMLTEIMKAFYTPVTVLLNVGLFGLFQLVKWLGVGLLAIVRGLAWVWNGILGAAQSIITELANALRKIPVVGQVVSKALTDLSAALGEKMFNLGDLSAAFDAMKDLTWEAAGAKAAETAAVLKNREALQQATEALTNVPSAWKVAQRRYQSQDAQSGGQLPGGMPATGGGAAPSVAAQPAPVVNNYNVTTHSPEETARVIRRTQQQDNFRRTGSRFGGLGVAYNE